ncbi:MAG: DUF1657 domain-containing protein [Bacillota bacterium]
MTVQSGFQKAIASAEAAKGSYAMFEQSTQDQSAKAMFKEMKADMDRHIQMLNSRLSYLNSNNQLNQQQQQQQQKMQSAQQRLH